MLTCGNTLLPLRHRRERGTFAPLVRLVHAPRPRRNPGHILDAERRLETRPRLIVHVLIDLHAADADLFGRLGLRQAHAVNPPGELHRTGPQRRSLRLEASISHDQSPSSAANISSEALCPNKVSVD